MIGGVFELFGLFLDLCLCEIIGYVIEEIGVLSVEFFFYCFCKWFYVEGGVIEEFDVMVEVMIVVLLDFL